jgi:hypothetical protein
VERLALERGLWRFVDGLPEFDVLMMGESA